VEVCLTVHTHTRTKFTVPYVLFAHNPKYPQRHGFYCSFEVNFYSGLIKRPDNELNLRPVLKAVGLAIATTVT
jgi:hypothetical protein